MYKLKMLFNRIRIIRSIRGIRGIRGIKGIKGIKGGVALLILVCGLSENVFGHDDLYHDQSHNQNHNEEFSRWYFEASWQYNRVDTNKDSDIDSQSAYAYFFGYQLAETWSLDLGYGHMPSAEDGAVDPFSQWQVHLGTTDILFGMTKQLLPVTTDAGVYIKAGLMYSTVRLTVTESFEGLGQNTQLSNKIRDETLGYYLAMSIPFRLTTNVNLGMEFGVRKLDNIFEGQSEKDFELRQIYMAATLRLNI
ncbi:MAG: outer membrane beta-barrel protein [Pseudomonadales bacterium]|nr:outer membrane beta-barrel protein [Pseudomonadales bacterium]